MRKSLTNPITTGLLILCCSFLGAQSQSWKPDTSGIYPIQYGQTGTAFNINFKSDGPLAKDWMYGGWLDSDSLRRCIAYREGGNWVPLPFSAYYGSIARAIEMYGDTMYIAGSFGDIVLDSDSSTLPNTGMLKWYNDSLWTGSNIVGAMDMASRGDTLLIWGDSYYNPPEIIYIHFMTTDRGISWQYPYSIVHPTENKADFGAKARLKILDDGNILVLNSGSSLGSPFRGVARWDGLTWHAYGKGVWGRAFDFEFYRGDLYLGGVFNQQDFPQNPGDFIVRWDGNQWEGVATGTTGFVSDLFVYNDILYCYINGGYSSDHKFGDAAIPYFAGWDGKQWCGTPFNFQYPPQSFGFANDTLFVAFTIPTSIDGNTAGYIHHYEGNFLNGPNAICSTLGLGEDEVTTGKPSFEIFPVPAKNEVQVVLPAGTIQHLKVYDLSGGCVLEFHPQTGARETTMDISQLVRGVYLMNVNNKHNAKFIKK